MEIDRAEQQRAMREEMNRKANNLLTQILNTDQNGRPPEPEAAAQPPAPAEPDTPDDPGPGDGGAREPLPAPSLQEQMNQATANGDHATAMSLKSQQLAAIVAKQNGM